MSLEHFAETNDNSKAQLLASSLDKAIEYLLKNGKSPQRKVGQLDNRGSHFYLALYWAKEMANQTADLALQKLFNDVAVKMERNESIIVEELANAQGKSQDIKGYYIPDEHLTY